MSGSGRRRRPPAKGRASKQNKSPGKRRASHRGGDRLTDLAHKSGYPARSVFKLEEIDTRLKILKRGQVVLDLGSSPGSWSLYAARKVGDKGLVLSVDLNPLRTALPPQVLFLEQDIFELTHEMLADHIAARRSDKKAPDTIDVVLSDMAPKTTGHRATDQARSYLLFQAAADRAAHLLRPGGHFVGKIFQGADFEQARAELRASFEEVKVMRPEATRDVSYEVFLVGLRKRPTQPAASQQTDSKA